MQLSKKFIQADWAPCSFEQHMPAPYLRKTFSLDFIPTRAEISICGLGFYELFINGVNVTKGPLAPYISNPDDICYYDCYDVAKQLKQGENVIGILLGNGFMNGFGGSIWDFEKAEWLGAPRVALSFSAEGAGKTASFEADTSFRICESPIRFDELRMGTRYDANYEVPDWNLPGFDDSAWPCAVQAETPRGEAKLCTADPIIVREEIAPVSVRRCENFCYCNENGDKGQKEIEATRVKEAYLYDFGVNQSGVCRLKIKGEKGQKIILRHSEQLVDGNFSMNTVDFHQSGFEFYYDYSQTDVYICKGGEEEIFVPPFTYHGFRYVLVEGLAEEQAQPELLSYLVMHSDVAPRGGFSCSDEMANKLQACTRTSDLANFFYFPTDCPHREKNGWTADAALSSEHMLLNLNAATSLTVWLDNIRKAQREDGALPGIIPTGGWGFKWGNGPAWDSVIAYLPYYIYKYDGMKQVITDNAEAMLRYLNYLTTQMDENGLIAIGLSDWVQPGHEPDSPDSPLIFTDSAMALDIANKAAFLFGEAGMTLQQEFAQGFADKMRQAIRSHLIDFETMTVVGNCQTSQTLAIAFEILEKSEIPQATERLLETIKAAGDFLAVGVIGGRYLFHVLAEAGYADLAYHMITRPEYPSYGNWVMRGATSLWEDFHDVGERDSSLNHHFWGDISSWFIQQIAGIRFNPAADDLKRVDITPHFIEALSNAEAYFDSVSGRISSQWKCENSGVTLQLEIPADMHGSIVLPKGWQFSGGGETAEAKSGNYILQHV